MRDHSFPSRHNNWFLLLIFCASLFSVEGQTNDSLLLLANSKPPSTQSVDALNELAWLHTASSKTAELEHFSRRAIKASEALSYLEGQCYAYQNLGHFFFFTSQLDSALFTYQIALSLRTQLGDSALISGTLSNIANVYKDQGKYFLALQQYQQADSWIPTAKWAKKARLKNNVGTVYTTLGNYAEALRYLEAASEILKRTPQSTGYASSLFNLANIYELMGDYARALTLYQEAEVIFSGLGEPLNLARLSNNIGNIKLKQEDLPAAITAYESALRQYRKINYAQGIAGAEQNLGLVYRLQGDWKRAATYFDRCLKAWQTLGNVSKEVESLVNLGQLHLSTKAFSKAEKTFLAAQALIENKSRLRPDLYHGLFMTYAGMGAYQKAFPYQLQYNRWRDSTELQKVKWRNLEAEYRESQNRNLLLEQERNLAVEKNRNEKRMRYALIAGLVMLTLLLITLYNNWNAKKKRLQLEKEGIRKQQEADRLLKAQELESISNVLEIQDKERRRIAQDLHDRLGSMLSMVKLHFQRTNENIEELKTQNKQEYHKATQLLDDACNEVRDIAHNLVSGVLKNFGLVAAVEELKNTLINTGQYEVEFISHQFDDRLSFDYEVSIYRIIQELTSNILRHAEANEISFQLIRKKDHLHIAVEDNGRGFDLTLAKGAMGMGFKNIQSRLLPLQGELNIDSHLGRGTSIFIDIPLNPKL